MERGFYHNERGYWQTNCEPDAETLASYPEGTVEVPMKPGADHEWDGEQWVQVASVVDAATIRARRDHAIASGIVTVGDAPILTDDTTQQRLTAAALAVTLDPTVTIRWKCADGCFRVLSSAQVIAAAQEVHAYVQACFDREAELLAEIEVSPETVDISTGWPGASN